MGGGREAGAVADGDQQSSGGPDADAGQRRQDPGTRVSLQRLSDLRFQGSSLFADGRVRTDQKWDHNGEGAGARDHNGLLVEGVEDHVDRPGRVVQAQAEDTLQAGVELGEQAPYPVGDAGLGRQVLVEAHQYGQLGGDLVGRFQRAQVCGIVRAASAITAASFASVFASPG